MSGNGDPSQTEESTLTTVWPTIAATRLGRLAGRLAGVRIGLGRFFTLGKLLAVATIPLSLAVFGWQLLPMVARRYRLTDRRILVEKGLTAVPDRWIGWDEFDQIRVEELSGQAWLRAGEVVFLGGDREVFRLSGVSRPEVFRRLLLQTQASLAAVRRVLREQASGSSSV